MLRNLRNLTLLAFLTASNAGAVIVNRIAISAGNRVITASEVDLRLRLTAFQNGAQPEFTLAARRQAAERLIDQKLVEREMEVGHYPRLNPEGRAQLLQDYAEQYTQGDLPSLERSLAAYGLTTRDLEDDLARQSDLLSFLGLRFRPAVQVTEEDLQKSAAENQVSLAEFRARLEQKLVAVRADADLDAWVKEQRKRNRIQYLDKDLAP